MFLSILASIQSFPCPYTFVRHGEILREEIKIIGWLIFSRAASATTKAHEILEWGLEGSGSLEDLEIPNLNILNLPNLLNLSQTFYIVSCRPPRANLLEPTHPSQDQDGLPPPTRRDQHPSGLLKLFSIRFYA